MNRMVKRGDAYNACDAEVIVKKSIYSNYGKRGFDIALSLLVAPIALPLIIISAALVRLDGGPAFFKQPRIGKDARVFYCLKLRTMHVDAENLLLEMRRADPDVDHEWTVYQKLKHDPRITRLGKFLRVSCLDELPQFINVLVGDMSYFGPRPFLPDQLDLYRDAGGVAYFKIRPGLSGPWQVSQREESTFVERIGFDTDYYLDLSLWTDLKLMIKTIGVVFLLRGR